MFSVPEGMTRHSWSWNQMCLMSEAAKEMSHETPSAAAWYSNSCPWPPSPPLPASPPVRLRLVHVLPPPSVLPAHLSLLCPSPPSPPSCRIFLPQPCSSVTPASLPLQLTPSVFGGPFSLICFLFHQNNERPKKKKKVVFKAPVLHGLEIIQDTMSWFAAVSLKSSVSLASNYSKLFCIPCSLEGTRYWK